METVDFLPERVRAGRARRRQLIRQGYLLALAVAGMVLLGFLRQDRLAKAQADLDMLQDRTATVQRELTLRDTLQKQLGELLIKERISNQLGSRFDPLDLMSELERLMPRGMSLVNLNLEAVRLELPGESAFAAGRRSAPAPEAKDSGTNRIRLQITGIAPTDVDIANFIGQLSASPLFEDVNMGYARSTSVKGHKAREFQALCYIAR